MQVPPPSRHGGRLATEGGVWGARGCAALLDASPRRQRLGSAAQVVESAAPNNGRGRRMELAKQLQAWDENASSIDVVDALLHYASDMGASDLHLDPGEDGIEVRVRYDGSLFPVTVLP